MKLAAGFMPLKKDMKKVLATIRQITFVHLPLLLASAPAPAQAALLENNPIGDVALGDTFPNYTQVF